MNLSSLEAVKRAGFRGFISTRKDPDYERLIHRWTPNECLRPHVVFEPICDDDVSLAVKYATSNGLEVAVMVGGHSFMGASSSEGGVNIDLRRMRRVFVNNEFGKDGIMTIEGGATVGDVAVACEASGTCTTLPAVKELGYTGFALGGGAGWTTGLYGFAVDKFLEVRVVLASGEIVTASNETNQDLFWAVKGAGYNFGVITEVKIQVPGLPSKVYFGTIVYPPQSFEAVFKAAERYVEKQQKDTSLAFVYGTSSPSGSPAESIVAFPYYHGDDEVEGNRRFQEFLDIPHIQRNVGLEWFSRTSDSTPEAVWPCTRRYADGVQFTKLSPNIWLPALKVMREWVDGDASRCTGTCMFLGFYDWSTVLANTGQNFDSAWPIRSAPPDGERSWRDCAIYISTDKQEDEEAAIEAAKEVRRVVREKHEAETGKPLQPWAYYPNGSLLPGTTGEYVFGANYDRLRKLKATYDPGNLFHKKHPIDPDFSY